VSGADGGELTHRNDFLATLTAAKWRSRYVASIRRSTPVPNYVSRPAPHNAEGHRRRQAQVYERSEVQRSGSARSRFMQRARHARLLRSPVRPSHSQTLPLPRISRKWCRGLGNPIWLKRSGVQT